MDRNTWLQWRNKGLGSSDAPIILGVSPWMTPYQLWEIKCGLIEKPPGNWATDRGNEMEPRARAQYELEHDIDMPPQLVIHKDFEWLRASLDGYNAAASRVLEIKCPGKDDHKLALNGIVPHKYMPQIQHQLLVTGAREAHYYSFDGNEGVTVQVLPDMEYISKMFKALCEFWRLIQDKKAPELTDRDIVKVRDPKLIELGGIYLAAKRAAESASRLAEKAKHDMLEAINARSTIHPRLVIGGLKAVRSVRKGNVDYSAIPELVGVDTESYRKPPSTFWTFLEGEG